ncbi:CDP-diacylglycerol--serine O-phosphatidyltransferase [Candidatus Woesearchaeota archaeon]|nr:CDP-diacylglycerol--serine O-phosphatidyltransferase [Candidatus Woesearchaeota archaeon]
MKLKIRKERVFFALTLLRWILAFVAAVSLLLNRKSIALFIFTLTAFVGFLEGFIAKKYPSALRSIADVFADKLLINLALIVLTLKGIMPWWAALIIIARDMLTVIGAVYLIYKNLRSEFKPGIIGKATYFFQVMALIPPILNGEIDWYLLLTALILTVISGVYALVKSEFRLLRKKRDDEFRIFSLLKFADLFTLANVGLGLVSIVFAISNNFVYSAYLLLAAAAIDYLDGKVAKILGQQNEFGKELDSLADTVSFGVAPAIFGFSLMQAAYSMGQPQLLFGIVAFSVFLFCGILRLARYNIMDMKGVYRGMPITLNGLIIPAAYFADVPVKFYPYIYLVLALLMVSSIRVKKLI